MKKLLFILVILFGLFLTVFLNLHSFLSPVKPVANAKILVVDAWLNDYELFEAAKVFKAGNYSYVLVPGGKLDHSIFFPGMKGLGDVSAVVLMSRGVPADKITTLFVETVKKDRTFQSALTVKRWMQKNKINIRSINVFTGNTHARRSWLLYKKAFKNECRVGIIACRALDYDANRWWKTSNGVRSVVDETIAYLYAFLFFHTNM